MAEIVINNFFIQNNIVNCSENVKKKEEKKNGVFVNRALEETLKLSSSMLRNVWNAFIDESSSYGEDSYIYDFEDTDDLKDLLDNMSEKEFNMVINAVNGRRFFQSVWTLQYHNTINVVEPKDLITRYWGDIITSVINFPYCYKVFYLSSDKKNPFFYYEEVVVPIVCERIGVECLCNKQDMTDIGLDFLVWAIAFLIALIIYKNAESNKFDI